MTWPFITPPNKKQPALPAPVATQVRFWGFAPVRRNDSMSHSECHTSNRATQGRTASHTPPRSLTAPHLTAPLARYHALAITQIKRKRSGLLLSRTALPASRAHATCTRSTQHASRIRDARRRSRSPAAYRHARTRAHARTTHRRAQHTTRLACRPRTRDRVHRHHGLLPRDK